MKHYACVKCGHIWFEPLQRSRKPGWGCPNGCLEGGREIRRNPVGLFEDIIGEILDEASIGERDRILKEISLFVERKRK